MARVDLTVLGGGIWGLSIAWEATRRGARVRLIERQALGAGASGGLVGALAPHVPEQWNAVKAFQLAALLAAPGFWAGVEDASGLPTGYARTHRWQPLADAAAVDLARARARSAADLWQGRAAWRVIARPDHPFAPASPTGLLIEDTLSARLHPRRTLAALARAIRSRGGEVLLGEGASEGPVIHATGAAGLAALSQDLGRPIGRGVKGQAASLACPGMDMAPQLYLGGLHIVPHADGTVAIGSTSETDHADPATTDAQLESLIARARAALPILADAPVLDRWAAERPRAATRQPILGAWPGRPGAFLANGGFKIGFGLAAEVARVMVDLVLDGVDTIPDPFRL
jgi:glycine/D-amino acid oxidase-like deaminating enzyme